VKNKDKRMKIVIKLPLNILFKYLGKNGWPSVRYDDLA
jgi:hypothetical protein